jgi:hypothetical protein
MLLENESFDPGERRALPLSLLLKNCLPPLLLLLLMDDDFSSLGLFAPLLLFFPDSTSLFPFD